MVKRLLSTLTLVATTALGASAFAQDYTLATTSATGSPGEAVTSGVVMDSSAGADVAGWSYGVCHDSAVATLDTAELGSTGATVNGGGAPDFNQINLFAEGYTIGAVISFLGAAVIAPGTDYELTTAGYTLGASGITTLTLCSDLGSPPVATVVVVAGQSVAPALDEGTLEVVAGPMLGFTYNVDDATIDFPDATGIVDFAVNFSLEDTAAAGTETQGFSIGLAHDGGVLTGTSINAIGDLAGLNGGTGPDFFGAQTLADGGTLGCVYSFLGTETLTFDAAAEIVEFNYQTDASLAGTAPTQTVTNLDFISTLGSPPVDNVVVVGGQSVDPVELSGAALTLNPVTGPALAIFTVGDTNQDGKRNAADPIYILNFLFAGGPALDCPASGDANDDDVLMQDDAILLLEHYFIGGAPPAGPYPDCGTRPGVEDTDCTFTACP